VPAALLVALQESRRSEHGSSLSWNDRGLQRNLRYRAL